MSLFAARTSQTRLRTGHEGSRVTYVELFFDLVFVFAVTQLSHGLLAHLSPIGLAQAAVLLVAMWWAWIDAAWVTNWLDPARPVVRIMLFALMLAGLVFSAALPKAFDDRGGAVAAGYVAMHVIRDSVMLWALYRHDRNNFRNFVRISIWHLAASPFWLAGCYGDAAWRLQFWALAVAIETAAPILGYWVPRLGRSVSTDWAVAGAHMAERCGLFIIIALGESILITGATFATLDWTVTNIVAFLVAFTGSVALWAVYFNIGAERASRQIETSDDPGRLARAGYTFMHMPIVAGIIVVAVGDELVLHHPGGHVELPALGALVGGPALYLIGNALFKRLSAPNLPLSHLVGLGLLALAVPASFFVSPLQLSAITTGILIVVATWEWLSLRQRAEA
ncbi:low temperature requirement protein A [Undibacter mobilis]|uniref:Low temperature requirement protein A n=1 Tax=Undibacter mobilis TaxID=2292256 RepID=A0A371BB31_9BRAD|nr:low temperature requirement protein A [Undibacter mobilis]RDV04603.1 low temperature requirement protein A [Undibacter mobilis]